MHRSLRPTHLAGLVASFGLVAALAAPAAAQPKILKIGSYLDGSQFVPPVKTTATGMAWGVVRGTSSVEITVKTTGLKDITGAHLHVGFRTRTGGIACDLGFPKNDGLKVTCTPKNFKKVGLTDTFAKFVERFRRLGVYINVHTKAHPAGEIRGQIVPCGTAIIPVVGTPGGKSGSGRKYEGPGDFPGLPGSIFFKKVEEACKKIGEPTKRVALVDFSAQRAGDAVALSWRTGSETQCGRFEILRGVAGGAHVATGLSLACEDSLSGAAYDLVDRGVPAGVGLSYILREHETTGAVLDYGPLELAAGASSASYRPAAEREAGAPAATADGIGCGVAGSGSAGLLGLALLGLALVRRRR